MKYVTIKMVIEMKPCVYCNNLINENENFCKVCGNKVENYPKKKDNAEKKVFGAMSVVCTIAYLGIYIFLCFIFKVLSDLGGGGVNAAPPTIGYYFSMFAISFFLTFIPCVVATTFSFISKKKGLIIFNLIFIVINTIIFFSEGYFK